MSLNYITIMGRLVKDPELRHTGSGKAVSSFCLAVERDRKNDKGEREVDWIDCTAWANTAEFAAKHLQKGLRCVVVGRLQIRPWTDAEGNKRRNAEVVVSSIYFADTPRKSEEGSYPASTVNYGPAPSGTIQGAGAALQPLEDDEGEIPF